MHGFYSYKNGKMQANYYRESTASCLNLRSIYTKSIVFQNVSKKSI